jgi:N-acetylmuramic acid 6-phosphate etherase
MVDMVISNEKLLHRARGMVRSLTDCSAAEAATAVEAAGGDIKKAVLIAMGSSIAEATKQLAAYGGNLRRAITSLTGAS